MPATRRTRARAAAAGPPSPTPTSPKRTDYASWPTSTQRLLNARREAKKRGLTGVLRMNAVSIEARIRQYDNAQNLANLPGLNNELARLNGEVDRLSSLHTQVIAAAQIVPTPAPSATNEEIQQLRDEVANLQQVNGTLLAQITAHAQVAVTPAPIATDTEILQLRADVERLTQANDSLHTQVNRLDEDLTTLQANMATANDNTFGADPTASNAEIIRLQAVEEKLEKKVEKLHKHIDTLNQHNEDLLRRIAEQMSLLQGTQLGAEVVRLQGDAVQLRHLLDLADQEAAEAEAEKTRLAQEIAELNKTVTEWQAWYDRQFFAEDDAQPQQQGQQFQNYQALVQDHQQPAQQRNSGLDGLREEMDDEQEEGQQYRTQYEADQAEAEAKLLQEERERRQAELQELLKYRFVENPNRNATPSPQYDLHLDNLEQSLPRLPEQSLEVQRERFDAFRLAALQDQEDAEREALYMPVDNNEVEQQQQGQASPSVDWDHFYPTSPAYGSPSAYAYQAPQAPTENQEEEEEEEEEEEHSDSDSDDTMSDSTSSGDGDVDDFDDNDDDQDDDDQDNPDNSQQSARLRPRSPSLPDSEDMLDDDDDTSPLQPNHPSFFHNHQAQPLSRSPTPSAGKEAPTTSSSSSSSGSSEWEPMSMAPIIARQEAAANERARNDWLDLQQRLTHLPDNVIAGWRWNMGVEQIAETMEMDMGEALRGEFPGFVGFVPELVEESEDE